MTHSRPATKLGGPLSHTRRRPRVLILGLPYFGRLMQRSLTENGWDARYHSHPGRDARGWLRLVPLVARADLVYFISARIDRRSPQAILAMVRRRPMVIHWVGADVGFALDAWRAKRASERLIRSATHLADAPWLIDELRELGIHASYAPMPVPAIAAAEPEPLPTRFRVLVYYPADPIDRESFDAEAIFRVIGALPEVSFLLIPSPPDTLPAPLPPNLEARAWVDDMDAVYRDISVYLRLTVHDGTSFMVIEALSRGRHVVWTFPVEGAIEARGFEQVTAALRELQARDDRGGLELNVHGREAVLRNFDPGRLAAELDRRLRAALSERRRQPGAD
jgi:hypothetical protein